MKIRSLLLQPIPFLFILFLSAGLINALVKQPATSTSVAPLNDSGVLENKVISDFDVVDNGVVVAEKDAVVVKSKSISAEAANYQMKIEYPKFYGLKSPDVQDYINSNFHPDADATRKILEEDANAQLNDQSQSGAHKLPSYTENFTVPFLSQKMASIRTISTYSYDNGSMWVDIQPFNVNLLKHIKNVYYRTILLEGHKRCFTNFFKEHWYVMHVRKALNGYLNGSNFGMATPQDTIEAKITDGVSAGLKAFDKEYYRSKFIVFLLNDFIGGGKQVDIIFQDRPDKVFSVWIYKTGKTYDLRRFWENKKYDEESMKQIGIEYKAFLEDKTHAL